jgi:hypothetical protein
VGSTPAIPFQRLHYADPGTCGAAFWCPLMSPSHLVLSRVGWPGPRTGCC